MAGLTPGGHVLLVGYRPHAVRAAERLGLVPLLLDARPPPAGDPVAHAVADLDGDVRDAVACLCDGRRVEAAVALTERSVPAAAAARALLGLPGLDAEAAARCHDKARMKQAVRDAGLRCADWRPLERAEDAPAAVDALGLPLVVKARTLSGSRGLVVARDAEAARRAAGTGRMAERFVEGAEMSVESFVAHGRILFVNPTEYLVIAAANIVPAPLDGATRAAVEDLNRRALAALGIGRGMTHLELFLTPRGPVFGEIAARPPGGRIMRLLRSAYGFDPWNALLRIERGEAPRLPARARCAAGAWVLHPGPGTVRSVEGLGAARAVPGIRRVVCRLAPGDTVAPRTGTGQDIGWIEARGPDRDSVARALPEAYARLRIEVG